MVLSSNRKTLNKPRAFARKAWLGGMICLFLVFGTGQASGQVLISILFGDKLQSDNLEFGLSVGGNFSTLSGIEEAKWRSSLAIGLYFNIKLSERFFIHAAAIPKSDLGARNLFPYSLGDAELDSVFSDSRVERILGYIHVPTLVRYKLPSHLGFEFGPVTTIRFQRQHVDEFSIDINGDEADVRRTIGGETRPFDFGASLGAYYKFAKGQGIEVNLRYYHGFLDIFKKSDIRDVYSTQMNRAIRLLVHIPIGRGSLKEKKESPGE